MIRGITIKLYNRELSDVDGFNRPHYSQTEETVDNILVSPSSSDDIIDSTNLYGKKAIYTLGIPKGDTHKWEDSVVEFFGHKWKIFSLPIEGIEDMIPLQWNKKYYCERFNSFEQSDDSCQEW